MSSSSASYTPLTLDYRTQDFDFDPDLTPCLYPAPQPWNPPPRAQLPLQPLSFQLLPELLDCIISESDDLVAWCLVSSACLRRAGPLLWREVQFGSCEVARSVLSIHDSVSQSPFQDQAAVKLTPQRQTDPWLSFRHTRFLDLAFQLELPTFHLLETQFLWRHGPARASADRLELRVLIGSEMMQALWAVRPDVIEFYREEEDGLYAFLHARARHADCVGWLARHAVVILVEDEDVETLMQAVVDLGRPPLSEDDAGVLFQAFAHCISSVQERFSHSMNWLGKQLELCLSRRRRPLKDPHRDLATLIHFAWRPSLAVDGPLLISTLSTCGEAYQLDLDLETLLRVDNMPRTRRGWQSERSSQP